MAPPATTVITLPYNFDPWPHQEAWFRAFYDHGQRRFFEVVHRRGGKDKGWLNLMIDQMTRRVGNYVHVFPQRNRARLIVWEGIDTDGQRYIDHFPPSLIYRKREEEMLISLQHPDDTSKEGSIYRCMGSDRDVYLLVGANPVGVIWSEFGEINPRMRELVLPILRRNGGWEAIICTPRGKNHAYTLYHQVQGDPEWHTSYLPITATTDHHGQPLVTEADVEKDRTAGLSEEAIAQEYYLSWEAPMPGAYYAVAFRRIDQEQRVTRVPYDPLYEVYTSWDLGVDDSTAIWFVQAVGREIRFIDYYIHHGEGLEHYARVLKEKPYSYACHFLPHDIDVREFTSGRSRLEVARALLPGAIEVVAKVPLIDGIQASRLLLARSVFDGVRCDAGLSALRSYRQEWDDERKTFSDTPLHDWASDGADAFRYLALSVDRLGAYEARRRGTVRVGHVGYGARFDPLTGEVWR